MKTKVFLACIFFVFTISAFAQTHQLKGLVKESNEAAAFYDIQLIANDTILGSTNENGLFEIEASEKNYNLQIIYFNDIVYEQEINLISNLDLGIINVQSSTNLNELVIEASKKLTERKADRFIYYVENSTATAGGTALDALKTTPGVTVTQENIGISGKNSVLVLIDDKPTYMDQQELTNYLESLSASNLSKIEVITTPPAKYQAEGNSGIINIVTKQIKQNSWNSTLGATYQHSRRNTQQYNAAFNLQKNKVTLQSSLNLGERKSFINWNNDIYYNDAFWQNENASDAKNKYISGKIALDYQLNKNWKVGTKASIYNSNFADTQPQVTTIFDHEGGSINQFLKNNATSTDKTFQQIYTIYSEYKLDTLGRKLSVDIDFVNYNSPKTNDFTYAGFTPTNELISNSTYTGINDIDIKIQNISGKADLELPTKFADFSTGFRFSQSTSKNNILALNKNQDGIFVNNENLSNYFKYIEKNQAVYFSANKKLSEKWTFQGGLRLEATQTEGYSLQNDNRHKNDYLKLFPTLYVMHNFTDENSLGFNYSRRISRPSYESLNPFRTINNEFSYNEGNPFLRPSFSHNFELTYTYKKLDSRIYASSMKDGVNQASMLNAETKQNNYIWMNYVDATNIGITESYTAKIANWWTSVNTFNFDYSISNIAISDQTYKGTSASFFTTNDFTLNATKTLFFSLSYFQNFGETYQNFELKPYAKFYATVKYLMLDKKLELSVSGSDIFNGREYSKQEMYGVTQKFKNVWDAQRVRFSLVYRFGNKNIQTNERQSGNSEELQRI